MVRTLTLLALCSALSLAAGCGGGSSSPPLPQPLPDTWVTQIGETGTCWGLKVATDSSGTTYVTGSFDGTVTLGRGQTNETLLTAVGESDAFVAAYSSEGVLFWAAPLEGGDVVPHDATVGADGTLTIVGFFWEEVTFDPGGPNETTLEVSLADLVDDYEDGFVARYTANGTFVWAGHIESRYTTTVFGAAARADNSVVVCGMFGDTLVLGEGEPNETTLEPVGGVEGYLAAYASNGTLLWAEALPAHDTGFSSLWSVATAPDGSVVAVGEFQVEVTIGTETFSSVANSTDLHLSRWDADGTFAWAVHMGGPNDSQVTAVAFAPDGSIGLVGAFREEITFGTIGGSTGTETAVGNFDAFLTTYSGSGWFGWSELVSGADRDYLVDVVADDDGTFYVAGTFEGTATLGAGQPGEETLTSSGTGDTELCMAGYDALGMLVWAERFGSPNADFCSGVAAQTHGDIVVMGSFSGDATAGDDPTVYTSVGDQDAILGRIRPD